MIEYINGEFHITDSIGRFGDSACPMVGDLLDAVLAAAELCISTSPSYSHDAIQLIRLAQMLAPTDHQWQMMADATACAAARAEVEATLDATFDAQESA